MRTRGVAQVAQFNWPKIVGGAVVSLVGLSTWRWLPLPARLLTLGAAFWTPVSLAASWWVYDHSPLGQWRFFDHLLPAPPTRILVIVAGFDEVSPALAEVYPEAELTVIDVVATPEASVRRARALYPSAAPVVDPAQLGQEGSYDLVLFAQSAHEIRDPIRRHAMFASARSAMTGGGRTVVVEHLRDAPNLVAFGPGALHFQSEPTWLSSFATGGLRIDAEISVTPLVRCWVLKA